MTFLIVSAILACAAAAPSHLLAPVAAPVAVAGIPAIPVAYSAAVPTLSPGDIQAAAIDAQVKANDLAIAAADKARELSELATEEVKEKAEEVQDIVKENHEEAIWAVHDKQWQALNALKTAEAQLDGAIASNAPIIAKHAVAGTYIAGVAPLPSLANVAYIPGFVAPVIKAAEPAKEEAKAEEAKVEEAKVEEAKTEEKSEALVKTAEENKDSVTIEAATRNLDAKPQLAPVVAPLAIQPYHSQGYSIVAPVAGLAPVALSPVLKYSAAWPQVGITSVVNTAW